VSTLQQLIAGTCSEWRREGGGRYSWKCFFWFVFLIYACIHMHIHTRAYIIETDLYMYVNKDFTVTVVHNFRSD